LSLLRSISYSVFVECELHSRIGRIAAQVVNQNNRRCSSHKTEDPDLKSHAQAGSLRVAPIGGTDEQSFHLAGQLSGWIPNPESDRQVNAIVGLMPIVTDTEAIGFWARSRHLTADLPLHKWAAQGRCPETGGVRREVDLD
jgi:hypothetical protein